MITILKSKRKTFAIEVRPGGKVLVRVPLRATRRQIDELLQAKAAWIEAAIDKVGRQAPLRPSFDDGQTFLYLGERYPLQLVDRLASPLDLCSGRFLLRRDALPQAAAVFERWYRQQARRVIAVQVEVLSRQHGLKPGILRINGARTRWGSCGAKGSLNFTWRLVLAPPEIVEYVVAHELAHLTVHNHSKAFWAQVSQLLPDYAARRRWLKEHGRSLVLS